MRRSSLQALQPWYGLADYPGYWWQTFKRYHINELKMKQSTLDPCIFFKRKGGDITGIIGTLVDDTLCAVSKDFILEEEQMSSKFDTKPKTNKLHFKFNGCSIETQDDSFLTIQKHTLNQLTL